MQVNFIDNDGKCVGMDIIGPFHFSTKAELSLVEQLKSYSTYGDTFSITIKDCKLIDEWAATNLTSVKDYLLEKNNHMTININCDANIKNYLELNNIDWAKIVVTPKNRLVG